MLGRVERYSREREYGFIRRKDGSSYYFHRSDLPRCGWGTVWPTQGEIVRFDVLQTVSGKNDKAIRIRYVANVDEWEEEDDEILSAAE